jgi:hypothetical protein
MGQNSNILTKGSYLYLNLFIFSIYSNFISLDPVPLIVVSPGKKKDGSMQRNAERRRKGGVYGTCARLPSALCCPLP